MSYQDPNFNKDAYWLRRRSSAADQRAHRLGLRYGNIVGMTPSNEVRPSSKPPTKKAVIKNSKRARKHITYAS